MRRHTLFATIATVAVATAMPALAKPGGNANVNAGAAARGSIDATARGSIDVGAKARGSTKVDNTPITGTRLRSTDRTETRSKARTDLSTMGKASFGADIDGMAVVDSSGATVGTVTDVTTKGNGSARSVQVTLTDGRIITLSPGSLTLEGDVLTTTSVETNINSQGAARANINGLINASPNSALASAGVTSLTGLESGLTVQNSTGADVGTVGQIFTNRSGAVVAVEVNLTDGGSVNIPATSLSLDGTTVISSSTSL